MFGSADDSKPIARRFPRRPVRAGKDATGGPGVASFARAYRVPIMIAVLVATVVTTAAVTSALVSRGPPKRPGIDAATLAGTCSAAADKARQDLAGLVVAALLSSASTQQQGSAGLAALASFASELPGPVASALAAAGGLPKGVPAGSTPPGEPPSSAPAIQRVPKDSADVWGEEGAGTSQADREQPQQQQQQQPTQQHGRPPKTQGPGGPPPSTTGPSGGAATGVVPAPASPSAARALLVICYNRPAYLRRTLEAVLARLPATDRPHIVVSQDGHLPEVTAVVGDMQKQFHAAAPDIAFSHIHHTQSAESGDDGFGYMKLSRHFGWALGNVFDRGHPRVIVLEDDLEIAADFFEYFSAVAPVLDADSTLLAASAYNDIGQPAFVADSARVYRSDFFPGLGWMLTRRAWAELGPKWPRGFWDDWLREPAQRKGRAFLRPEVSRTRTFGERGVSQSQFFHQYLSNIKLNAEPVAWGSVDLQYLLKPTYDRALDAAVAAAQAVPASSVVAKDCSALPRPPATGSHPLSVATRAGSLGAAFKVDYGSVGAYPRAAGAFGFIADVKAGVPRTAYRGVVSLQHKGCFVYLVPAGGAPLPER